MILLNMEFFMRKIQVLVFSLFFFFFGCAYHPDYPKLSKIAPGATSPLDGTWANSEGKDYHISGGRVYEASIIEFSRNKSKANYNVLRPIGWNLRRIDTGVYALDWLDYDPIKKISDIGKAKIKIIDLSQIRLCIDENPITGSKHKEIELIGTLHTRANIYLEDLKIIKEKKAKTAWNNAKQKDTIADYNQFVISHPKSKYTNLALSRYLKKYNWSKQMEEGEIELFFKKIYFELHPLELGRYGRHVINENYYSWNWVKIKTFSAVRSENGEPVTIFIRVESFLLETNKIQIAKKAGDHIFEDFGEVFISISLPIIQPAKGLNDFKRVEIFSSDIWNGEYINEGNGKWRIYR